MTTTRHTVQTVRGTYTRTSKSRVYTHAVLATRTDAAARAALTAEGARFADRAAEYRAAGDAVANRVKGAIRLRARGFGSAERFNSHTVRAEIPNLGPDYTVERNADDQGRVLVRTGEVQSGWDALAQELFQLADAAQAHADQCYANALAAKGGQSVVRWSARVESAQAYVRSAEGRHLQAQGWKLQLVPVETA